MIISFNNLKIFLTSFFGCNLNNKKMNQLEIKQVNQLKTEMINEGLCNSLDSFTAQDLLDIVHDRIVEKFNNS